MLAVTRPSSAVRRVRLPEAALDHVADRHAEPTSSRRATSQARPAPGAGQRDEQRGRAGERTARAARSGRCRTGGPPGGGEHRADDPAEADDASSRPTTPGASRPRGPGTPPGPPGSRSAPMLLAAPNDRQHPQVRVAGDEPQPGRRSRGAASVGPAGSVTGGSTARMRSRQSADSRKLTASSQHSGHRADELGDQSGEAGPGDCSRSARPCSLALPLGQLLGRSSAGR